MRGGGSVILHCKLVFLSGNVQQIWLGPVEVAGCSLQVVASMNQGNVVHDKQGRAVHEYIHRVHRGVQQLVRNPNYRRIVAAASRVERSCASAFLQEYMCVVQACAA